MQKYGDQTLPLDVSRKTSLNGQNDISSFSFLASFLPVFLLCIGLSFFLLDGPGAIQALDTSHLWKRGVNGGEIFYIKETRWMDYWLKQDAPVMLVIGTLAGEGERMGLSSVRRWREKVLSGQV